MYFRLILCVLLLVVSGFAIADEGAALADEPLQAFYSDSYSMTAADIRGHWRGISESMKANGLESSAARLDASVDALSDGDLVRIYGNVDFGSLADVFSSSEIALDTVDRAAVLDGTSARNLVASIDKERSVTAAGKDAPSVLQSPGLPDALGYPGAGLCPASPNRTDANALISAVHDIGDARLALEIAQGIWSPLSRACDEIIVVLGEGFNTSLACIPADIALFAAELVVGSAETVVEHAQYCNEAVNSAEIEGAYDRAGHLHSDLVTHDEDISNQLAQHDEDISNQLAQHDTDIKALLGQIQDTVDENQRLIKISMSRQLEIMRLLITPSGRRVINQEVLTCTGDNCPVYPAYQLCPNGELSWNCGDD